jgi:hypothetical protein
MISRIKLTFKEIREAILLMQEDKLPEQMLKQFLANAPTNEEKDAINEYLNEEEDLERREERIGTLGKAEQFFVEVPVKMACDNVLV